MKEIRAYIREHKLDSVLMELHRLESMPGVSVSEIRGCGAEHTERGHNCLLDDLVRHIRLEIVCRDEQAEGIAAAIEKAAHTGRSGDGKIFIGELQEGIRIHTGERGSLTV